MAHDAKWKSNVMLSIAGRLSVGLILIAVVFTGCNKSPDDFQVITEEMTQPTVSQTDQADSTPTSTDVNIVPLTDKNADPEPATPTIDEPDVSVTTSSNVPTQDPDSVTLPDEKSTAETVAVVSEKPEGAAGAQEPNPDKKLNGFINLQEEMERQKRIQKLGLGQSAEPAEPREIKLLVKNRDFSKESATDAWRVTYNDLDLLKILNMEPVPLNAQDYLPEWLTALDGKKIILRGWMFPPDRAEGIKGFIFVRDNQVCCFGPNAKAYDKLTVRLKKGDSTNYIQGRPFDVVGTFKLDAWIEDERDMRTGKFVEKLGMLYHIEDAVVVD